MKRGPLVNFVSSATSLSIGPTIMLKRRQVLLAVGASVSGLSLPALGQTADSSLKGTPIENIKLTHLTVNKNAPVVFYSPSVSPQAVLDIFKAVGLPVQGKVGLKVVFGNQRDRAKMIDPALLKPWTAPARTLLLIWQPLNPSVMTRSLRSIFWMPKKK